MQNTKKVFLYIGGLFLVSTIVLCGKFFYFSGTQDTAIVTNMSNNQSLSTENAQEDVVAVIDVKYIQQIDENKATAYTINQKNLTQEKVSLPQGYFLKNIFVNSKTIASIGVDGATIFVTNDQGEGVGDYSTSTLGVDGTIYDILSDGKNKIFFLHGERSDDCKVDDPAGCLISSLDLSSKQQKHIFTVPIEQKYGSIAMEYYNRQKNTLLVSYYYGDGPAGGAKYFEIDATTGTLVNKREFMCDSSNESASPKECVEMEKYKTEIRHAKSLFSCSSLQVSSGEAGVTVRNTKTGQESLFEKTSVACVSY